ncbi:hypothetical protein MC885_018103 [Smutsia gigantea]|nr:hypothetical protein MC885_018103 [Smutsia gigantea]
MSMQQTSEQVAYRGPSARGLTMGRATEAFGCPLAGKSSARWPNCHLLAVQARNEYSPSANRRKFFIETEPRA